jgi:hypothetical protein
LSLFLAPARNRIVVIGHSSRTKKWKKKMRLYIFRSEVKTDLRAFASDSTGSKLPTKFAPWTGIGVVASDRAPPHGFSRAQIENALNGEGFQLWRLK